MVKSYQVVKAITYHGRLLRTGAIVYASTPAEAEVLEQELADHICPRPFAGWPAPELRVEHPPRAEVRVEARRRRPEPPTSAEGGE